MKFKIGLVRTAYQFATVEVEADDSDDAFDLALEKASELDYSGEKSADYEVDYIEVR